MKIQLRKHLQEMKRLRVGAYRDINSGFFLDRNERIVPYSNDILSALNTEFLKLNISLYPDVSPFYDKLAGWLKVDPQEIYITEGVSGAIKSLIETLAFSGDNIIFPSPTFAMYPVYSKMFNLEHRIVGYKNNYQMNIDQLINYIDNKTIFVFLPNPNVPIEGILNLDQISEVAKYCLKKNCFLIIDEVYYPFGGPTALPLLSQFENLIIMRSFSKAFGLAGIRLGYIVGNKKYIEYISKMRTGYETNTLSMAVANFFINHENIVYKYIQDIKNGFRYLKNELDNLGIEYNGGKTSNFLYINLKDKYINNMVVTRLKEQNIFVRGGWPEPFSTGFAVTGAPKDILAKFLDAFINILNQE